MRTPAVEYLSPEPAADSPVSCAGAAYPVLQRRPSKNQHESRPAYESCQTEEGPRRGVGPGSRSGRAVVVAGHDRPPMGVMPGAHVSRSGRYLFTLGQNPPPLQLCYPCLGQLHQKILDRLSLMGRRHLHLPHQAAGDVAEVPGAGAVWWSSRHAERVAILADAVKLHLTYFNII